MNKYFLKPEFLDCTIITKTSDGTEIVVDAKTFNDTFAEMMLAAGQGHLIQVNRRFIEESTGEKKSFVQISDELILLASPYQQVEGNEQKEIASEQPLKRKRGRQPKQVG